MRVVTTVASMQRLARPWLESKTPVALVPTMGYLHAGHVALMEQARRTVGRKGRVVVSIYVNPSQFAPTEDLAKYPRDLARDKKLCRAAGVDAVFVPNDREMYPAQFSSYVVEEKLSHTMEGASRPNHFRGVATIVAKLFNIVRPNVAIFGAKDFQQAAVVKRMARDLNFPLEIIVVPTVREKDGLAMSSRNKYLSPQQREQAVILWLALQSAHAAIRRKPVPASMLKIRTSKLMATQSEARLDYVEFFDPDTLEPVQKVVPGTQMALAVFVGKTRLIDNATL